MSPPVIYGTATSPVVQISCSLVAEMNYGQQPPKVGNPYDYSYQQQQQPLWNQQAYGGPHNGPHSDGHFYPPQSTENLYQAQPPAGPTSSGEKFPSGRKYKDGWAAGLFLLNLLAFIGMVIYGVNRIVEESKKGVVSTPTSLSALKAEDFIFIFHFEIVNHFRH